MPPEYADFVICTDLYRGCLPSAIDEEDGYRIATHLIIYNAKNEGERLRANLKSK